MNRLFIAMLLCLAGSSRAEFAHLGLRMPERDDWALQKAVFAELQFQDRVSEGYASGGVSGSTHILIGGTLMIGGLLMPSRTEGNGKDLFKPKKSPTREFRNLACVRAWEGKPEPEFGGMGSEWVIGKGTP